MILPRQYGGDNDCYQNYYGEVSCYNSAWNRWIRWLVLGLIIAAAILLFFLFSCLSARRRRRQGFAPYRGTGWATGHGPATYNPQYETEQQTQQPYYNNSNNPAPPPAYSPPPNNNYYGPSPGIELQEPSAAYQGAYAPPKNPPTGKDNIVR